jgi:hypothetical protein
MIHFKLDTDTSFAQLTDGRLDRYGIATVTGRNDIWGRLTATLILACVHLNNRTEIDLSEASLLTSHQHERSEIYGEPHTEDCDVKHSLYFTGTNHQQAERATAPLGSRQPVHQ